MKVGLQHLRLWPPLPCDARQRHFWVFEQLYLWWAAYAQSTCAGGTSFTSRASHRRGTRRDDKKSKSPAESINIEDRCWSSCFLVRKRLFLLYLVTHKKALPRRFGLAWRVIMLFPISVFRSVGHARPTADMDQIPHPNICRQISLVRASIAHALQFCICLTNMFSLL